MDDFSKILWGFIFSAIGIALGWTLNQMGQWFRTIQEDKKNLKIVLFNLLETYFIFVRSDIDKIAHKVTEKVFEKIPQNQRTDEGKKFLKTLYLDILTNYFKPELLEKLKTVQENYQNSIKTLASIDPLTAYYLSGKTNIIELFDTMQSCFDNLKQQFPENEIEIEIGAKQFIGIVKPDIVNETLIGLEKDIRNMAWKINPYVWCKSIKAIKRLKLNANEKLDTELDKLFNKLSPLIEGQ